MTVVAPLVLMVDDDSSEHARVRKLLPPSVAITSAYSATQALDRCRQLIASRPEATIILILDYRLPDLDGALLAAKLRELLPEAPIVVLSSLPESGPLMGVSGATVTLNKRISDDELRTHLHAVLARPLATMPDPIFAPYLARHASTLVNISVQRNTAAVLASSRPVLQLLAENFHAAGLAIGAKSISANAVETMLDTIPVHLLVCDGPVWSRARTLAEARSLPLLVVAMSLSMAISLSIEPISVIVAPEPGELPNVVEKLLSGGVYRDQRISAAYETLELTPAERLILAYILRGIPMEEAARALNLTESATRKARGRAFARLNAERVDDIRFALDELLVR